MTTLTAPSIPLEDNPARAISGAKFDWLMALLGGWLVGGLYLDGWAHVHISDLESFFTPWHGVLYSGFLVQAGVLAGLFVRNLRRGQALVRAMPSGYGFSLIGAGVFMIGGLGDVIWHNLFGIEVGVEALLSPTHLLLALGGGLLITGPLRAGLRRLDLPHAWLARLPTVLSATLLLSVLTFFTDYAHPFATTWITTFDRPAPGDTFITQAIGITSFLFQSALLTAIVLLILRNQPLPAGSMTILIGLNTALMVAMHDIYLNVPQQMLYAVGALAGLTSDLILLWLKPSATRIRTLRLFAFILPFTLFGFYIVAALLTVGVWWSIHLWTGAIVLSGVTGWLMSYLLVPSGLERVWLRAE